MASLSIGSVLRQERLRQNLGADEISRRTRIAQRFIEALERDDFEHLPATVFTRGFVQQYCKALDIDSEPLLRALPKPDIENAPLPLPPPGPKRMVWDPRVKSALQTVVMLGVASLAITAAWTRFSNGPYFSFDSFRVRTAEPVKAAPQPHTPAPAVASTPVAPEIAKPVEAAPAEPEIHAAVEVAVAASQTSWVRITADGKVNFAGLLRVGEKRRVSASQRVTLLAGNAGGVEVTLNGKKLDPMGPPGQVRSVILTAEGPQPVAQTPPPSSDQQSPGQL